MIHRNQIVGRSKIRSRISILVAILGVLFQIPAFAYEPIPIEIKEFVDTHLPTHKFLDTDYHAWIKDFPRWKSEGPFPKTWALHVNFNGDSVTDWVGYLVDTSRKGRHPPEVEAVGLYCICSINDTYESILLGDHAWQNLEEGVDFNLIKRRPGTYVGLDEAKSVKIENESVQTNGYLSPVGILYYWDSEKARGIALSD